jgi:hypothetical protein
VRTSLTLLHRLVGSPGRKSNRRRRVDFRPGGLELETKDLQGGLRPSTTLLNGALEDAARSLRGGVELALPADSSNPSPRDLGGIELARPGGMIKHVLAL